MNTIYKLHEANPYYVQAVGEHRCLHAVVDVIRRLFERVTAHDATSDDVAEAQRLLGDLRDRLDRHFRQEEAGGYLEEAIVKAPSLSGEADRLERQHAGLLADADRILELTFADAMPQNVWASLKPEITSFAERLTTHEAAETDLLQRAFNEDLGL